MTQKTILIIVGIVVGIIYLYYFYRLYKKLKTFPNRIIMGIGVVVMLAVGVGLYTLVHKGVPYAIDIIQNKQAPSEQVIQQTTTTGEQHQNTGANTIMGSSPQTGDTLFSGLNANATEEEVVSWSTLKDKLKHVEVTEKHGSPSGSGSAQ